MSNTARILRPATAPKIHVLEVDGPRRKFSFEGEGDYRLSTDNQPIFTSLISSETPRHDPRLKDWPDATWEIIQYHDGRVEVLANRPTEDEIHEGDLHGQLGSVIKVSWPCRFIMRKALRLARLLCVCHPTTGIHLTDRDLIGITVIQSRIPCFLDRKTA